MDMESVRVHLPLRHRRVIVRKAIVNVNRDTTVPIAIHVAMAIGWVVRVVPVSNVVDVHIVTKRRVNVSHNHLVQIHRIHQDRRIHQDHPATKLLEPIYCME